ncbi:MAG: GEVED domain-containing protein [Bacteroidota bacterium]
MIKHSQQLLLAILLLALYAPVQAQLLTHVQGELLVQLRSDADPSSLLAPFNRQVPPHQDLQLKSLIAPHLNIYQLTFDHNQRHERHLLDQLRAHPAVLAAQFNHLLASRNQPDDPDFGLQWHLLNPGNNGGLLDADLDADEAWDICTGGLSPQGDTIVVCIIDDGFESQHPDLAPNHWRNHQEIPDNGLDDDGNGYIDDVEGWNVRNNTDELSVSPLKDLHGMAVAGIVGARGDNGLGISGINWQVKLMLVVRGETEAEALAAYEYPLRQRQLYRSSRGQKGAFVVATNASWGIPYRRPKDAPLWCALYDSLGQAGILNCAATANLAINVDELGDLPSTCPSDYLVCLTNLNRQDEKVAGAAFGPTSVDLGAYGQEIYTLSTSDGYGLFSGTSAAAPMAAGAVGLLYAAPCPGFITLAKAEPDAAALLARRYLIEAAQPNSRLTSLTSTGKRLNLASSLEQLMNECNFSGCYTPFDVEIQDIEQQTAHLEWKIGLRVERVDLRYRKVSDSLWIVRDNVSSNYGLQQLSPCSRYEFQFRAHCDTSVTGFSRSYTFETKGCCRPPFDIRADSIDSQNIFLSWSAKTSQSIYQIRYRPVGGNWINGTSLNNNYWLGLLQACTNYEIQIRTFCSGNRLSPYSTSAFFSTVGCSICVEGDYCTASGPSNPSSWIAEVSIANLFQESGRENGGYSDFTAQSVRLARGFSYPLSIRMDYAFFPLAPYISVWLDVNQNGSFEAEEELISKQTDLDTEPYHDTQLNLPDYIPTGSCRMRVAAWSDQYGPCHSGGLFGEVEDYCVDIVSPEDCLPPLIATAIPSENQLQIGWRGSLYEDSYILRYRPKGTLAWSEVHPDNQTTQLKGLQACTDYEYQIQSVCDGQAGALSELFEVRTLGCGSCLDLNYCESKNNAAFEWIDQLQIGGFSFESGNDHGYGDYGSISLQLNPDQSYAFELQPGWANEQYQEFVALYLDLNHDGQFDEGSEKLFTGQTSDTTQFIAGQFYLPASATLGSTRMRVMMKYNEPINTACDAGFFGEVEDYCVNIGNLSCSELTLSSAIQNEEFTIDLSWLGNDDAIAYNLRYRPITMNPSPWQEINTANTTIRLLDLDCIFYEAQIRSICENSLSNFSASFVFEAICLTTSDEEPPAPQLSIFPNPFHDRFHIQLQQSDAREVRWQLRDVQGRLIDQGREGLAGQQSIEIEASQLAPGMYLLSVEGTRSREVQKLVKL